MASGRANQAHTTQFEFQRPPSFLLIIFMVVPALLLLLIAVTVTSRSMPAILLALLGGVAASCVGWLLQATRHIGPVTVELSEDQIKIKQLVGSRAYRWSDVQSVELFNPQPSLSSRRGEQAQAGLGINLRPRGQKSPPPTEEGEPHDTIAIADSASAPLIITAHERIRALHQRAQAGPGGRRGFAVAGGKGKGFRKPQQAAAGAA